MLGFRVFDTADGVITNRASGRPAETRGIRQIAASLDLRRPRPFDQATAFSGMKNSRDRSPAHRTELLQTTAPSFAEHLGSGDEALGTVTLTPKPAALPLE
jgi:hypothetical protein